MRKFVAATALAASLLAVPSADSSGGWLITAYCLSGRTATGAPVGPGVVAVDPRVIRLGSRLWVSGYGLGRALDTGGAVVGFHVDVWIGDCRRALAFTHRGAVVVLGEKASRGRSRRRSRPRRRRAELSLPPRRETGGERLREPPGPPPPTRPRFLFRP